MMPSSETNGSYLHKRATRNKQRVNINGIYSSQVGERHNPGGQK